MVAELSPETMTELQRYVRGELSNDQLDDWLTGAEYDPALPQDERDALAWIRLVVIDAEEGIRSPAEVLNVVAAVLAAATPGEPVISPRSGSGTLWEGEPKLTAMPAPLLRVGI